MQLDLPYCNQGQRRTGLDGHTNIGSSRRCWRPISCRHVCFPHPSQDPTCLPVQVDPKAVVQYIKDHKGELEHISNPRQQHATWHSFWFCSEAGTFNCCWPKPKAKAIAIMKLANMKGFVNLSQSVERMGLTKHIPCITPCGEFYHLGIGRYLLGLAG